MKIEIQSAITKAEGIINKIVYIEVYLILLLLLLLQIDIQTVLNYINKNAISTNIFYRATCSLLT